MYFLLTFCLFPFSLIFIQLRDIHNCVLATRQKNPPCEAAKCSTCNPVSRLSLEKVTADHRPPLRGLTLLRTSNHPTNRLPLCCYLETDCKVLFRVVWRQQKNTAGSHSSSHHRICCSRRNTLPAAPSPKQLGRRPTSRLEREQPHSSPPSDVSSSRFHWVGFWVVFF